MAKKPPTNQKNGDLTQLNLAERAKKAHVEWKEVLR
jgi:hypothetical protein